MSKQETLEEAIKREYETRKFNSDFPFDPQSFKLGAKWQQERMYSEEINQDKQMSRQTAVDYLFNDLIANPGNFIKAYKQAKEMEKEQIKEAFKHRELPPLFVNFNAEEYYNKTYKKEEK
jgi:hypothetical protein